MSGSYARFERGDTSAPAPAAFGATTVKFDDKGLPAPYNYATQVINGQPQLVWPKDVKSADIVYPKPAWGTVP